MLVARSPSRSICGRLSVRLEDGDDASQVCRDGLVECENVEALLLDALADFVSVQLEVQAKGIGHVIENAHWERDRLLEDHADAPPEVGMRLFCWVQMTVRNE